jgi:aspartate/methionine/tyrosine aminotransferase
METTSKRGRVIQPSVTLELSARAKAMAAAGEPVVNLSAGEPDLPTPAPIVEAAHRALDEGHFGYTPAGGVPALREMIARDRTKRCGVDFEGANVIVTNGAKQALFNAISAATDPGDRIGIPVPYWVTYAEQARALGCEPVFIDCPAEDGFAMDLDALDVALARGLRLIILNSPSNPTGAAWNDAQMSAVLERVASTDTLIVTDEIYEDIVFNDRGHVAPLALRPDLADRTCVVSGLSKGFAMTGWRVGYSVAPRAWSGAMNALQGHSTSNVCAIAQQAALAAVERHDLVAPMVEVFRARRDRCMEGLETVPMLTAHTPEATFYLYIDVASALGQAGLPDTVDALATWLLEEQKMVMVPGTAFGDPRHLRMSFACSEAVLDEAFTRLRSAFSRG